MASFDSYASEGPQTIFRSIPSRSFRSFQNGFWPTGGGGGDQMIENIDIVVPSPGFSGHDARSGSGTLAYALGSPATLLLISPSTDGAGMNFGTWPADPAAGGCFPPPSPLIAEQPVPSTASEPRPACRIRRRPSRPPPVAVPENDG